MSARPPVEQFAEDIEFCPGFLSVAESDNYLQALSEQVVWRRDEVTLFGRTHPIPRLHQWYADKGLSYTWSGLTMQPQPWFTELQNLRNAVAPFAGEAFNSVLINLYRDGNDSMGWHSDDEAELGPAPVIASVSLGAARDFQLRERGGVGKHTVQLTHGSLLVMRGATQSRWQHALPKRRRVVEPRINLTFRRIIAA